MANTFITPTVVAKLAIISLLNNWVFAGLVHRDYAKEYRKVGETVRIRKPPTLTAIEFDGDLTGEFQAITESYVDVKMDKILTVPIEVSAKELTLDIVSFQAQVIDPAVQALAQAVDENLAKLYKDVPYVQDITETSEASIIASLLDARKQQNNLKVPFADTRYAVMSPLTTATLLALSAFRDVEKTGETKALREASLGRKFGYEYYENQNIQTHAIGTTDTAGAIDLGAGYAAGATTIHVDTLGTGTINKGSILTIADVAGSYVVTEDATIAGNECDIKIYPGLADSTADDAVVTIHAAATTSKENLMFHKNAFALVTAPMAEPIGGAKGTTVNYKGLSINVVYGYAMNTMKNIITASILCGFKTLTPELAIRLYEAS